MFTLTVSIVILFFFALFFNNFFMSWVHQFTKSMTKRQTEAEMGNLTILNRISKYNSRHTEPNTFFLINFSACWGFNNTMVPNRWESPL